MHPDRGGDLTVLELNTAVKQLLSSGFPFEFWIRGVITGLRKVSGRGHTYFQLADPSEPGGQSPAVVDCALFAGDNAAISLEAARSGSLFQLENNKEVRILARINFWERSGRFQIVMKGMDHLFTGESAAIHLMKLVARLSAEGVLDENKTLDIPSLPMNVGLVTSKGSAAEKDFVKTLEESSYPFRVYASYASMQGSETGESVYRAITAFLSEELLDQIDVLVLTRGGGSATDLAWFNDERLARTIAQLPWPVISGIGHEIDTTLPDHAAHTRAKTPTHAASLLVDHVAGFDERLNRLSAGLVSGFKPRIQMERMKIDRLAEDLSTLAKALPGNKREELERLFSSLQTAVEKNIHEQDKALIRLQNEVDVRDPVKMMKLGWAMVKSDEGVFLRSAAGLIPGDHISVVMQDAGLKALIEEKTDV